MLQRYQLPGLVQALQDIHYPRDKASVKAARRRLAFQELVLVQMAQLLERYWLQRGPISSSSSSRRAAAIGRESRQPAAAAAAVVADMESPAVAAVLPRKPGNKATSSRRSSSSSSSSGGGGGGGKSNKARSASSSLLQQRQQHQQGQQVAAAAAVEDGEFGLPLQHEAVTAYQVTNRTWLEAAQNLLPYRLTVDQQTVLSEILSDMSSSRAMLRLLQGDVGCGKTVVAVLAALAAAGSGETWGGGGLLVKRVVVGMWLML
jgi:RecG-like helicase